MAVCLPVETSEIREQIGSIALLMSTLDVQELADLFAETRDNRYNDVRDYIFIKSVTDFRTQIANWLGDHEYISEFDNACDRAQRASGW